MINFRRRWLYQKDKTGKIFEKDEPIGAGWYESPDCRADQLVGDAEGEPLKADPEKEIVTAEDVVLEIAADLDLAERDVRDLRKGVSRELRLGDRVVLELEIGCELHQLRPVGARASAHQWAMFSSSAQLPSKRTTPRSSPPG